MFRQRCYSWLALQPRLVSEGWRYDGDNGADFATHNLMTINAPVGVLLNAALGNPATETVSAVGTATVCRYVDATEGYRCITE